LPWHRRDAVASAAALAALFNAAAACGSGNGSSASTTTSVESTSVLPTSPTTALDTTSTPVTDGASTTAPAITAPRTTVRTVTTTAPSTTRRPTSSTVTTPTTTATTRPTATVTSYCVTNPDGTGTCAIPGRPLRRRRRGRTGFLLPVALDDDRREAGAEYASVASFGDLALRLVGVGAPADLVAACHRAALDEIRHASVCDALAGRPPSPFGAIPGLLGRRLGGWRRSRRIQLRRLAVESFLDGWVNEGAAAADLRERAERATSPEDEAELRSMAEDEQRHAELARSIVTWCFEEDPVAVGRALAAAA